MAIIKEVTNENNGVTGNYIRIINVSAHYGLVKRCQLEIGIYVSKEARADKSKAPAFAQRVDIATADIPEDMSLKSLYAVLKKTDNFKDAVDEDTSFSTQFYEEIRAEEKKQADALLAEIKTQGESNGEEAKAEA